MIFQILLEHKPLGQVAYPSLAQAALVWRESGRSGRVVTVNTDNRIVHEFTAREMEEAAAIFPPSR